MLSVKGKFQHGAAQPTEPLEGHEGETVIITFLAQEQPTLSLEDRLDWQALSQLIENCAIETGVSDLAQQHDHYLYGKPKSE